MLALWGILRGTQACMHPGFRDLGQAQSFSEDTMDSLNVCTACGY